MTAESMIKALAELDGWHYSEPPANCPDPTCWMKMFGDKQSIAFGEDELPPYLTSRDSIIKLMISVEPKGHFDRVIISEIMNELLMTECGMMDKREAFQILTATPHQLATALLKATERYEN